VDHHGLDQAALDLQRLVPHRGLGQGLVETLELGSVYLCEVRVQPDRRGWVDGQPPLERRPPRLEIVQALLQARCPNALGQSIDQLVQLAIHLGQLALLGGTLCAFVMPLPVAGR
jgi:hypothetical protein